VTLIGKTFSRLRQAFFAGPPISRRAPEGNGGAPGLASAELAWADGLFFSTVPMERWNPDELIWRRGFAIYRKMLLDDQVRALIALKQSVIVSRKWHFEVGRDDPAHQECAAFFRALLEERLEGTFSQVLREILSSQAFGFSLIEKVYGAVPWQGRELWGVARLKLRPPETFSFETDAHGNLTGLIQQQGGARVHLPPERFIRHINKPEVHAQYGESDLRECHRHWWSKDNKGVSWSPKHTVVGSGDYRVQGFFAIGGTEFLLSTFGQSVIELQVFRSAYLSANSIAWVPVLSQAGFREAVRTSSSDILFGYHEELTLNGGTAYRTLDSGSSWLIDGRLSKKGNVRLMDNGDGTVEAFTARITAGTRTDRHRNFDPNRTN
jgi:hypothetical protein